MHIEKTEEMFLECRLCPRECGTNRLNNDTKTGIGFCGEGHLPRIAYMGPHFGEEPPITGSNGSGTIFFTGCSLKCSFCQNYQISSGGMGKQMDFNLFLDKTVHMIKAHNVHNINFVTPDHFFPYTFRLVSELRKKGYDLPIVYNLSGYQSIPMLKTAEYYANIYLPDYKYSDKDLAERFSKCRDYPIAALDGIAEMIRQKGFLEIRKQGDEPSKRGVLVRHLILPGQVNNSINALTTLFLELGPFLPLSIMSQYQPVIKHENEDLNRTLLKEEFDQVYDHALDLGFENLFVQFPNPENDKKHLLPDFRLEQPFPSV